GSGDGRWGLGWGGAALFLEATLSEGVHGRVISQERSFFGTPRFATKDDAKGRIRIHGNTRHGWQRFGPEERHMPRIYYHPSGPMGQAFATLAKRGDKRPIAVVGLGAGSLAALGQPGQALTFYRIDPLLTRPAR